MNAGELSEVLTKAIAIDERVAKLNLEVLPAEKNVPASFVLRNTINNSWILSDDIITAVNRQFFGGLLEGL